MFDNSQTPDNSSSSSASPEDLLSQIKNEQGEPKYADVTKALEALKHSQDFIPQLKGENETLKSAMAEMEERLAKAAAAEELLAKLGQVKGEPTEQQGQPESNPPQAFNLDEQQLSATLEKLLDQRSASQIATDNQKAVTEALVKKFGDKAQEQFNAKAGELGLSAESLEQLSAESPKAVLAYFNVQAESAATPTSGTIVPPRGNPPTGEITPPESSLLSGAKSKDQIDYLLKIRKAVYEKHNIQV
jgi:hypothetical protein